jgi:hypothetical protein
MNNVGILPCLKESASPLGKDGIYSNLRESTVVPEIALVGEAVADESKLALLGILL